MFGRNTERNATIEYANRLQRVCRYSATDLYGNDECIDAMPLPLLLLDSKHSELVSSRLMVKLFNNNINKYTGKKWG